MTPTPLSSRRRSRFSVTIAVVAVALVSAAFAGCGKSGSSGSSSGGARPTSAARLQIMQPTPNQVTGPDVTVQLQVSGGEVVPLAQVTGPLRGDQGHIHVSLDGNLVSMTDKASTDLHGLTPGSHTIQAEYVAVDHQPFKNRVIAAVIFQVHS